MNLVDKLCEAYQIAGKIIAGEELTEREEEFLLDTLQEAIKYVEKENLI